MNLGTIGLLLGASFASGINLYATVATLGLLHRFEVIALPPSLAVLSHPVVLGIAIALYLIEFVADKIPVVDHVWDAIHTFVRPPAAALLAYAAVAPAAGAVPGTSAVPEVWRIGAALVAGSIAFTAHSTKAAARGAVNASPEPFSTAIVSFAEDLLAVGLAWLAATNPVVAIVAVVLLLALSIVLLWILVRFARGIWRRLFGRGGRGDRDAGPPGPNEKPAPA
ncbi:MAG TPA: DUF4126 domain-containing protein [Candidatus Eisenbacteria bacterium]|nr:DUF4126 domain-containing protein [Candidatus Eisenbacteria bacterium]